MVRREEGGASASLALWKRSTAICALVMFPAVPLVLRYAEPLVVTLFGDEYLGAAVVMQLYMLVVIRECFDFSPALRARARTAPLVYGTLAGLIAAVIALYPLIKTAGIAGAMGSFVIGSFVEALWLAVTVMALYGAGVRDVLPWRSLGKVVLACGACVALYRELLVDGHTRLRGDHRRGLCLFCSVCTARAAAAHSGE